MAPVRWLALGAVLALAAAGLLFQTFVRAVPAVTGAGVVTATELLPATTYAGPKMTVRGPTVAERRIEIPARYRYTIAIPGRPPAPGGAGAPPPGAPRPLRCATDTRRAPRLAVGQPVVVWYERRGVPRVWERVVVRDLRPDSAR